jgi:ABC-type transporter Mla MlaB component
MIDIIVNNESGKNCLVIEGSMTFKTALDIESKIINTMRASRSIDIDLSRVTEIDRHGLHLINFLKSIGGKAVNIISASPAAELAISAIRQKMPLNQSVQMAWIKSPNI